VHKPVRLDRAKARRSGAVLILEANSLRIPARARNRREEVGVDAWAAPFERNHESVQGHNTVAEPRREHLLQLEKRAHGGLFHAADAALSRRSQSEGNGDSLIIVQQQRGQRRARAQLISALHPGGGMDGISKAAQAIHITAKRSSGYVETP
jgi:hypothetical protein